MIIAIFDSKLLGKIDCILDEELHYMNYWNSKYS